MAHERRGLQQVRTLAGLVDGRRARTSAGALLELSMLEMEKTRLTKEIARADHRCGEIRRRLDEINAKQRRLQGFVERPAGEPPAAPLPVHAAPPRTFKRRRLLY